ncbi:MAG: hypothetical protein ACRDJO_11395 [Actinomycetota bacterium]
MPLSAVFGRNPYWGLGRSDIALEVAHAAAASIHDVTERAEVEIERARLLGRTGNWAAAVATVQPLLDRVSGTVLVNALMAAGTYMAVTGRTGAVLDVCERAGTPLAGSRGRSRLTAPTSSG